MATADKNVLEALKRERRRVKGTLPLTAEERRLTGKAADAYAEKLTRELERFYLETAKSIRAELGREDLTLAKQSRLSALLSTIEAQTVALHRAAIDFSGKAVPLYYMRGVDTASGYLDSIGFGDIGFAVPGAGTLDADTLMGVRLHRDAVAVLADSLAQDLVMANLSLEQTAARFVREAQLVRLRDAQMTRAVAEGLVTGATRREVSSDILNVLRKGVVENGLVNINGRRYKPEAYASLVARTRTREAVNQGRINFAAEYGVDLFEIDTHESACPYCRQYVGRVYSISGATDGFPKLQVMPPYHPHCKCNGYPVPLEHLESLPYFEALKRFSNKPNADFEEFLAHKQDLLAGYTFQDSGHATSGGIVMEAGMGSASSVSAIRTSDFTRFAERMHVKTAGFEVSDTIRTITANALYKLSRKGLQLPREMAVDAARFKELYGDRAGGYLALYDGESGRIHLNPLASYWEGSSASVSKKAKSLYEEKEWSSAGSIHPILHEFAHFLHDEAAPEAYRAAKRVRFSRLDADVIANEVSRAATENAAEFVAEVKAGMLAGRTFSKRLMEWYNSFGGPA